MLTIILFVVLAVVVYRLGGAAADVKTRRLIALFERPAGGVD